VIKFDSSERRLTSAGHERDSLSQAEAFIHKFLEIRCHCTASCSMCGALQFPMAAQAQEARDRLEVNLQDVVNFFQEGGCESKSIAKLLACLEAHAHFDFLELSEGYSKCMAFIDHDALSLKIQAGWSGIEAYLLLDKKVINRRLRTLEEDKKSDPEVIAKLHAKKDILDQELARVKIQIIKYTLVNSISIQRFYDKSFNAIAEYDRRRELAVHK
jgi:hypothetical protein